MGNEYQVDKLETRKLFHNFSLLFKASCLKCTNWPLGQTWCPSVGKARVRNLEGLALCSRRMELAKGRGRNGDGAASTIVVQEVPGSNHWAKVLLSGDRKDFPCCFLTTSCPERNSDPGAHARTPLSIFLDFM